MGENGVFREFTIVELRLSLNGLPQYSRINNIIIKTITYLIHWWTVHLKSYSLSTRTYSQDTRCAYYSHDHCTAHIEQARLLSVERP
jgi:hypothetical protein